MQLLKRILTAVLLIPVVLALVLRAPVPVLALVAALVALLAIQELLKLSEAYKVRPFHWPTYIFVGLFFLFPGGESRTRESAALDRGVCRQSGFRGRYRSVRVSSDRHAPRGSQYRVSRQR